MKRLSLFLMFFFSIALCDHGITQHYFIDQLSPCISLPEPIMNNLHELCDSSPIPVKNITTSTPFLFDAYPQLSQSLSYVTLGDLPTPITHAPQLTASLGVNLYIKRDDLTGKKLADGMRLFGGNKVRKLEFLLADALACGARSVVTFGCAGSNHALATAVYAQTLGLECTLMLKPQWNSHVLRRNLLMDMHSNAKLVMMPNNNFRALATACECATQKQNYDQFPYIIPTGGSCARGIIGFVNAAFELQAQIAQGLMPNPTRIYVPVGSCGTIVGLLVGLAATGYKGEIVGVTVEPEEKENEFIQTIQKLFAQTISFLQMHDAKFPSVQLSDINYRLLYDFCGNDYALFTPQAIQAIKLARESDGIILDGVYSGKCFSGMLADIKAQHNNQDTILFWHTFCSDTFEHITKTIDYHQLPASLQKYFIQDVQELDRI
jgi:1-aminocyclopropane-1-carboxylate deaminase/D-cysteine desulfhydrase-like pyridoxal-dependent ACC family enzyme